jgi:8-oxo-dGTP pyrophosphatase MutT (NUDIX family)
MSEALPDADDSRAPTGDFIRRFREIDARFEPRPWPWAEERREAIAAYWARRAAAQPSLFNGRVLLIGDHAIEGDVFRATYFATEYANFLYWLDRGTPDCSVFNGFAMGAGQGSDGCYVLGVMGAHTATAGKVYFPAGTPDRGDLRPDGTVDLATSVVREMEEETGLRPGDYIVADGWIAVRTGRLIAFMRPLFFREPAAGVQARIRAFLARQREPELADVRIVRSLADLDEAAMPAYLKAFLRWAYEEAGLNAIRPGRGDPRARRLIG